MPADLDAPARARSRSGYDLTPPTPEERRRLEADLSGEERRVLLDHGTERAFCGVFLDNKQEGAYECRLCGLPLYRSSAKFDSGTGWPSFFAPFDDDHLKQVVDRKFGMTRTELRCARCDSHQGHVFPDGPPPTGQRHCLNSVSLSFTREGEPTSDRLGRGAPEGRPLA
ncbi:MAG: peptide-methionine (R)-S-oxide reductase MsrB [Pseudomonadota bacterium]|nr:peptide-methionine (R)-S-oxide reductase MsrB [Pseudomonadota bacterium]